MQKATQFETEPETSLGKRATQVGQVDSVDNELDDIVWRDQGLAKKEQSRVRQLNAGAHRQMMVKEEYVVEVDQDDVMISRDNAHTNQLPDFSQKVKAEDPRSMPKPPQKPWPRPTGKPHGKLKLQDSDLASHAGPQVRAICSDDEDQLDEETLISEQVYRQVKEKILEVPPHSYFKQHFGAFAGLVKSFASKLVNPVADSEVGKMNPHFNRHEEALEAYDGLVRAPKFKITHPVGIKCYCDLEDALICGESMCLGQASSQVWLSTPESMASAKTAHSFASALASTIEDYRAGTKAAKKGIDVRNLFVSTTLHTGGEAAAHLHVIVYFKASVSETTFNNVVCHLERHFTKGLKSLVFSQVISSKQAKLDFSDFDLWMTTITGVGEGVFHESYAIGEVGQFEHMMPTHLAAALHFALHFDPDCRGVDPCQLCIKVDTVDEFENFATKVAYSPLLINDWTKTAYTDQKKFIDKLVKVQSRDSGFFSRKVMRCVALQLEQLSMLLAKHGFEHVNVFLECLCEVFEDILAGAGPIPEILSKLSKYIATAEVCGRDKAVTTKVHLIMSGRGGIGKTYLVSIMAMALYLPTDRAVFSASGEINRISDLLWSSLKQFDEVFAGITEIYTSATEAAKASRQNPLLNFSRLDGNMSMLYCGSVKPPRTTLSFLPSAGAPREIPNKDRYRHLMGKPAITEEEYSIYQSQVERRFQFLELDNSLQKWSKFFFDPYTRNLKSHWSKKVQAKLADRGVLGESSIVALSALMSQNSKIKAFEHLKLGEAVIDTDIGCYDVVELLFYSMLALIGVKSANLI